MAYNPRRTNSNKRNKLRARVLREEQYCWLCEKPVDVSLPHGLPGSPEVDEVIPVSKGGDPYDRKNCRLAHRLCLATKNEATGTVDGHHHNKSPSEPAGNGNGPGHHPLPPTG